MPFPLPGYLFIQQLSRVNREAQKVNEEGNGAVTDLEAIPQGTYASAIYISNGDIYLAGYKITNHYKSAVLWKNGALINLISEANTSSAASSVYVK
jgi:hypothetical protein